MAQLHQIIALEKGAKDRAASAVTTARNSLAKAPLLSGVARNYQPRDDEGERLPPESTRVQLRATDVLAQVQHALGLLFDITLTKDVTNAGATAPIVLSNGTVLAESVPVTYLVWAEQTEIERSRWRVVSRLKLQTPQAWPGAVGC